MTIQNLRDKIIATANIYQFPMTQHVMEIHLNALKRFRIDDCLKAYSKYLEDHKSLRMPTPGQIIAILEPGLDDKSFSVQLARSIITLCARRQENWVDGYFSENGNYFEGKDSKRFSTFQEALISECGELAVDVVKSRGGWVRLCNSFWEMDEGQFFAQLRDDIQSMVNLKKSGFELNQIAAPSKENQKLESKQMSEVLALIKPKEIK